MKDPLPKEFRVTVRLRNNRLIAMREARGMSAPQVAADMGLSYQTYIALENLRRSPKKKNGDWTPTATQVAAYYHLTPDFLWPDMVLRVACPTVSTELDGHQIAAVLPQAAEITHALPSPDPFVALCDAETEQRLSEAIASLDPVEQEVIERRMRGETLRDVAAAIGYTRQGAANVEARATSKLRDHMKEHE